jgi:hypothetical protein
MFCILGFLCGAKSYKTLCSFIEETACSYPA